MNSKRSTFLLVVSLVILVAASGTGSATAASDRPAASFYPAQSLKADGLRLQALARRYQQLTSRPAAAFYTARELKVEGLRWEAMARPYRTASNSPAVTGSQSGGFDWGDAGIGAAGGLGLAASSVALVLVARRARREEPAHT